MPTPPPDRSRRSLNHGQRMFLLYGPADPWVDAFADEDEVCAAWNQHRARILGYYRGTRPWGWWRFEAGDLRYPGYDREQSTLYEAGLLGEQERAELLAEWRRDFERAWSSDFFHCEGPGRFFQGAPARCRHFAWSDIPAELVKQWSAEYRRRRRMIRQLEETVTAEQPMPAA